MKMTTAMMVIIITMEAKMNIMIEMIKVMLKTDGGDVYSVDEYGDEEDDRDEEVDNNNYGEKENGNKDDQDMKTYQYPRFSN